MESQMDGHASGKAGDAEQRPKPEGEFRDRHGALVAKEGDLSSLTSPRMDEAGGSGEKVRRKAGQGNEREV
jgi:hypothetical protein